MSKILVSKYSDLTKKLYAKVLIDPQIPNFLKIINYTANLQYFTSVCNIQVVTTFMPFFYKMNIAKKIIGDELAIF